MKEYQDTHGHCPNCKSTDLDYGTMDIQDDGISYRFECNNCGFVGKEWYNLIYDMTTGIPNEVAK